MMNEMERFTKHDIRIWKDEQGWHYDGPASAGPRHVRQSGRGPYWIGPVSAQFIGSLRRAIARLEAN